MRMTEKSDFHEHLEGWFAGRLPSEWFVGPIDVTFDRDEILVVGTLAEPELPKDAGPETRTAAADARISGFREDTRAQRMRIADEAERRFGRKISWGARCADQRQLFTTLAIPAMTRTQVCDTCGSFVVAPSPGLSHGPRRDEARSTGATTL